jgi:hypothetical protein
MWATAADHLVDCEEIASARGIAAETLEEREEHFVGKEHLYDECKAFVESYSVDKQNHFVCSFTEKEDSLSHWKEYCPRGGVSIRFSIPTISKSDQYLNIENGLYHNNYYAHETYLHKCMYGTQEQRRKANQLL